ncbi:MAG: hypothetical protein K0R03_1110 [Moraxellaceae bacterium]|jgi:hypothetical protein|nr:hypothetical protein [Moraxellaceae bacterium]
MNEMTDEMGVGRKAEAAERVARMSRRQRNRDALPAGGRASVATLIS